MGGLTLLLAADWAGLKVTADGDRLVVRGPNRLKPLADQLLAHKADVMRLLRDESWRLPVVSYSNEPVRPGPPKKCYGCGHVRWFTTAASEGRAWQCGACHPPISAPENIVWWDGNDNVREQRPLTSPHAGTRVVRTAETG